MLLKYYRVRLIAPDLLSALANFAPERATHFDIVANDMESAWRKFCRQKKAPILRFGQSHGAPSAGDYDIRLERTKSV